MRIVTCASVALIVLGLAAGGCLRDKDKNQTPAGDVSADEQATLDQSAPQDGALDLPSGNDILAGDVPSPGDLSSDQNLPIEDVVEVGFDSSDTLSCTPNCGTKVCGPDGCGGNCGTCAGGQECTGAGTCSAAALVDCISAYQAVASCNYTAQCLADTLATVSLEDGKELTDFVNCLTEVCPEHDGLCTQNATVGECSGFYNACADTPPCIPQCTGKECGGDGCGGTCGTCAADQYCDVGICKPSAGACPGPGISLGPCAPTLTLNGCCTDSQRVYFCQGGETICVDCAAASLQCGWTSADYYDCGLPEDLEFEDPVGGFPRLCSL